MDSRTEKKIEKALDRADKQHDKAAVLEAKGRLGSADRHEHKATVLEQKADQLAHKGVPAGGLGYTGLGVPLTGATAHPTYGYSRIPRDKKAERLEAKAVAWEQRGNAMKAQKNRDKALRHRQRMMPGYVPIAHPQPYYVAKADRLDQRALRYQQMGLLQQAQRNQQRALRVRSKHGVPASTGMAMPMTSTYTAIPTGTVYKGLNQPYTSTTQHPKFGYAKLTSDQKHQRYNAKAAEWERRGDLAKAQKNRDKANRYRAMNQAGYKKPTRSQDYYINRAANLDQKAVRYQQLGRNDSALRAQQRAQRIRTKHNIPLTTGLAGAGLGGMGARQQYSGLNIPYTGATQHPKYGYQKLTPAQKAQRFDLKAAEWQKRNNTAKYNKNRDKANRYRSMGQPGYVRPTRDNNYYTTRAQNFDQRALRYQQMGRPDAALRSQQRAQRIRAKHNIPMGSLAKGGFGNNLGNNQGQYLADGTYIGPIVPMGTVYKGLSHPYTGASAHPQYGYQRLSAQQKVSRFEAKAAEWERRGNMAKAQKNREKANRYRMRGQPGYVKPVRAQDYYVTRANTLDQRALGYRNMGRNDSALRAQQRAQRIRTKHGLPLAGAGLAGAGAYGASRPVSSTYSGISFPYTGAAAHPTYGYQRLPHNKKAERFEAKAAEYEKRGNLNKAQKNRLKAQKYRARSQPGYVAPVRPQSYYVDRANTFDQRALQYQQWGMAPQAQRYQGRAQRVRAKRGLPAYSGVAAPVRPSYQYNPTATYSGINFPYTGAAAHPTYGYQRLPHNKKAERFEAKAAEYERRGNLNKAQKNRLKAQKYRARSQPGYVAPVRPQTYYVDRANAFDQRAQQYQTWGMAPQAQRYQGRAQRVRAKRGIPVTQAPLYTTTATF